MPQSFSLDSFLPGNKDNFIRYNGSLTTPNCNEVVTWTLFNEPILISHTQVVILINLCTLFCIIYISHNYIIVIWGREFLFSLYVIFYSKLLFYYLLF